MFKFIKKLFGLDQVVTEEATVESTEVVNLPNDFEPAAIKPQRTRDSQGKFQADDPTTPNVNEAWVGGKSPAKKTNKPRNHKPDNKTATADKARTNVKKSNTNTKKPVAPKPKK